LVNPNEFYFNAIFDCANRLGYQVNKFNYMKWKLELFESVNNEENIDDQNALYPMLTFFGDDYESKMTQKRPWYDNTFTLEILKDSGISCPSVVELLGTYYSFLCKCGFLKPPSYLSSWAKQKKYFEYLKDEKKKANEDYKQLMRRNRIDSSDHLSEY